MYQWPVTAGRRNRTPCSGSMLPSRLNGSTSFSLSGQSKPSTAASARLASTTLTSARSGGEPVSGSRRSLISSAGRASSRSQPTSSLGVLGRRTGWTTTVGSASEHASGSSTTRTPHVGSSTGGSTGFPCMGSPRKRLTLYGKRRLVDALSVHESLTAGTARRTSTTPMTRPGEFAASSATAATVAWVSSGMTPNFSNLLQGTCARADRGRA